MNHEAIDIEEDASLPADRRVRRRRVIYLHGFDPARSERYRRLIERAGRDRGETPPEFTPVGPISEISEGWRIRATDEGRIVETVFEILRYDDVVRHWRRRAPLVRIWTGLGSWGRFMFGGGWLRCLRFAKGPAALVFHPVLMLLSFVLLGVGFGRLVGEAMEAYLAAPGWTSQASRAVGAVLGFWVSLRLERTFFAHLMLALFDFLIRLAEDKTPTGRVESRIDAFADRLVECVADAEEAKVDEILIVGHSLGGYMAVRTLARALERDVDLAGGRPAVSLLTLGSVGGYVACRGGDGAENYAADVGAVASDPDIAWVDVSAPRDWFSFGLVDPLLMTPAPPAAARSPLVISAKFGRFKADPDDRRTRFRAMGLHMKYLAAPDRKGGFDFFRVVAGRRSLSGFFAGRRDSPKARMRDR